MNIFKLIGLKLDKIPNIGDIEIYVKEKFWVTDNFYLFMVKNARRTILFLLVCLTGIFFLGFYSGIYYIRNYQKDLSCEHLKPIIERNKSISVDCII